LEIILSGLEVKSGKNNRITFLAFVLIYYRMYIIVQSTIMWKPFWKQRTVSISIILTKSDTRFYNMVIYVLFNYMHICLIICVSKYKADIGFYDVEISAIFTYMRFIWNLAYFTVMIHVPANKLTLHILLL